MSKTARIRRRWGNTPTGFLRVIAVIAAVSCLSLSGPAAEKNSDVEQIKHLLTMYAASVDRADPKIVDQVWSNAPEASFIHPLGEEHGRAQIEQNVITHLMGDTFSERKLTIKDVSVHVYEDAAWSQFNWDFVATVRKDGSPLHTEGRETQVYHKEQGRWRLVHVHYSGMPVTAQRKGF